MQRLRSHTPLLVFALGVAAIYGVALVIVSRLTQFDRPGLIAGALTVDLTLVVPMLYYLLMVRWRGWPVATVLPVFLVSVAVAESVIPETQHHVLGLMFYGVGLVELLLVGIVVRKTWLVRRTYRIRAAGGLDVYAALRESAVSVLGSVAGSVLAYEVSVLYYALLCWRREPDDGAAFFSYHRATNQGVLAAGLMIAIAVETVGLHLLLQMWSPLAAWILTGISVYTLIWLLGDTQAMRLRPIRVSDETLQLRAGLRWTLEVPIGSVERVTDPADSVLPRRTPGYLNTVFLGTPNCRIELSSPVDALGPYGLTRRVSTIDLQIDEPERLHRVLAIG